MPTLVTFYALNEAEQTVNKGNGEQSTEQTPMPSELVMAANLSVHSVKNKKKTTVLCASQTQAEAFDEFIWQYPAEDFVPHNLYGEGPEMGTPLEVIWSEAYQTMTRLRNRSLVINLSQSFISNFSNIQHIIDFVPVEEDAKAQARERYKQYKQAGCQLEYKASEQLEQ